MKVEGVDEYLAVFDTGSELTLINEDLIKCLGVKLVKDQTFFKTVSGHDSCIGRANIRLKIGQIEKIIEMFIVKADNFKYDILLGLDAIRKFRLKIDENLQVKQVREKKVSTAEINLIKRKETKTEDKIEHLILKYEKLFAKHKYDVGRTKLEEGKIKLKRDEIIALRPYRCNQTDQKEIEEQVQNLLKYNLIKESHSPFSAPVTLANKRDEGRRCRLVVDYRKLNDLIELESYPFPRVDDMIEKTVGCKYFTTLDINSAFWSVAIMKKDRPKTAFVTTNGHFEWKVMPFGFKNSPAIFQRVLSSALKKHKVTNFATNYMDDILIYSKNLDEHLKHVEKVMIAMKEEGFKLKKSKCKFAQDKVEYLGHLLSENSVQPLNDNLKAIKEFPVPKNQTQVRSFLGKLNYYYKFIENASKLLEPMHNLLRKNVAFIWNDKCQKSFEEAKKVLCSSPVLSVYDPKKTCYVFTDASMDGLGAVLKQQQKNGLLHPIAYFSMRNNESTRKKPPIFLECKAIKEALLYWHHYLFGTNFVVVTDHKPLENLKVKATPDTPLGEMIFYISQYTFKLVYRAGKENVEADCLSRSPVLESFEGEDHLRVVNLIERKEIEQDQKKIKTKDLNPKKFGRVENLIVRHRSNGPRIVVSEDLAKVIIDRIHTKFGHLGMTRMNEMISRQYHIFDLSKKIKKYVERCDVCVRRKSRTDAKLGHLSRLGPAERPFQIMSIDTVGGFAGANSTKKYMHLLIDHFTRYVWALTSATQTAKNFINLIKPIKDHGVETLLADQYTGINSQEFKRFVNNQNITLVFTTVDCARSNGMNERVNQTIVNRLRCKFDEGGKTSWASDAKAVVAEYNKTPHSSTGFAPEFLLYGKHNGISPIDHPIELEEARRQAFVRSNCAFNRNKARYDKGRKNVEFKEGDLVYINSGNRLNRHKLHDIKQGPFRILKRHSNSMYYVDVDKKRKEGTLFNISKLYPFIPPEEGGM